MKDILHCDNENCKYQFKRKCIQSWFCIIGVQECPNYIRTHKDPDELYAELFSEGKESCGGNDNDATIEYDLTRKGKHPECLRPSNNEGLQEIEDIRTTDGD